MSVTFESLWLEYEPTVNVIAYEYGCKGHRYGAEASDFRQEFVCWMLDQEKMLGARYEESDPDEFEKFFARCLRNEGNDYLVDIRDQAGGQPRQGAYWYTTGELKTLLPSVFDPEAWNNPPQYDGGGGRSSKPANEGNNWITTLADVARGFMLLEPDDQILLRQMHQSGWRNKDLAEEQGISEASMSYRHTRALKRLLEHMGGPRPEKMRRDRPHDPWRGRHAVSNASARALTRSYYDGDDE